MQFQPQGDSRALKSWWDVTSQFALFIRARKHRTHLSSVLLATLALGISLIAIPARGEAAQTGSTQNPAASSTSQSNKQPNVKAKPHHRARRHTHPKPTTQVAAPPTPSAPVPPAQQAPAPATVEYRDGQLHINAQNSSLVQILTKVSQETGLVVDGLGHDQRIYGQFGPGPIAATLSSLLDGAGYNYVLVGDANDARAAKLLLTPRAGDGGGVTSTAATTPAPLSTPASSTPKMANPSEPPHPKTPQEIFEELRRMHPQ